VLLLLLLGCGLAALSPLLPHQEVTALLGLSLPPLLLLLTTE
jgi:hypothetical protein